MSVPSKKVSSERATFGMGCFWAGDSLFGATEGVIRTCVGYSGGSTESPNYKNIGDHTEVIDIEYDPQVINYSDLLDIFWNNHEYGLNAKVKSQYRSLILYHDEEQRAVAQESLDQQEFERNETFTTEIKPFEKLYPAEDYHQKYRLQKHSGLLKILNLTSGQDLISSKIAAKLNGCLGGAVHIKDYDRISQSLELNEESLDYVRKHVIESYEMGPYC